MTETAKRWPGRQWHVGETGSTFVWDIKDNGEAADMSNVAGVTLSTFAKSTRVPKIEDGACVIDVDAATVTYHPAANDMDTSGKFRGQLKFTMNDASEIKSDWFEFEIQRNLPA